MSMSTTTTRKIRRIAPLQLAKMLGVLYGLLGLLFLPLFLLFTVLGSSATEEHRMGFAAVGVGFALFIPFMYAALGFVFGIVGAAIYNVVAKWIGGVELDIEDVQPDPE
jgi:hypothetical protein